MPKPEPERPLGQARQPRVPSQNWGGSAAVALQARIKAKYIAQQAKFDAIQRKRRG